MYIKDARGNAGRAFARQHQLRKKVEIILGIGITQYKFR